MPEFIRADSLVWSDIEEAALLGSEVKASAHLGIAELVPLSPTHPPAMSV